MSQVRGIPHSRVVHPEIVSDTPHDYRTGVQPNPHLELNLPVCLEPLPVPLHSLPDRQGRMTSPLPVILMGHRCAKQGHHPITRKLIDRPLVPMNLIHQDLEAAIHDLVDFLGVEFLGHGGVIGYVGEEDGYELPLTLDGASGGEDFLREVSRRVGLGLRVVNQGSFFELAQVMAALLAKSTAWKIRCPAVWAIDFQVAATLVTELGVDLVLKLALGAVHPGAHPRRNGRSGSGCWFSGVF